MIALLQVTVIRPQSGIISKRKILFKCIKLVVCVLLEFVAQPCGKIPFLIRPRNRFRNGYLIHSLVLCHSL